MSGLGINKPPAVAVGAYNKYGGAGGGMGSGMGGGIGSGSGTGMGSNGFN